MMVVVAIGVFSFGAIIAIKTVGSAVITENALLTARSKGENECDVHMVQN